MKINWLGITAASLAFAAMSSAAHATVWLVNCQGLGPGGDTTLTNTKLGAPTENFGTEPGGLTGSGAGAGVPDALGALLGTGSQGTEGLIQTDFATTLNGGDIVEITGICSQVVAVRTSGVTITGRTGNIAIAQTPPTSTPIDGDSNEFVVNGVQRITLNNVLIGSPTGVVTLPTTGFAYAGQGLLVVGSGAQVTLQNSEVANSSGRGIFVASTSSMNLQSSIVTGNGSGTADENYQMGIDVIGASSVLMGNGVADGTAANSYPSSVTNNTGDGIRLAGASDLALRAGSVTGNLQKQLFAQVSSGIVLNGNNAFTVNGNAALVSVTAPAGDNDLTIGLEAGASLLAENQVAITGGNGGTTIGAYGSSTVLLEQAFVSGGTTTIEVTGGSLLALAGGNYICNGTLASSTLTPGCTASTGASDFAISVDHVGALYQVGAIPGFNFTAMADTIAGGGVLQLQSTADLGAGQIGSSPSLLWATGSNGISVAQNSSFRLLGGVTIIGVVNLAQGSNGFVNTSKTPGIPNTNSVTQSISCPFVTVPASHLQLGKNSLAASTPPTTLATSFAGASSPQCLPF